MVRITEIPSLQLACLLYPIATIILEYDRCHRQSFECWIWIRPVRVRVTVTVRVEGRVRARVRVRKTVTVRVTPTVTVRYGKDPTTS